MKGKGKSAIIGGLLAVVFVMSVGYAAFATQLQIHGSSVVSSKWDIRITNITTATPNCSASVDKTRVSCNDATLTRVADDGLSADFVANLASPSEKVTYTVTVTNNGNLPAKLGDLATEETQADNGEKDGSGNVIKPFIYSNTINKNDVAPSTTGIGYIAAGASKTFNVTVEYNPDITKQPTVTTSKYKIILTYVQAA